MIVAGLAIAMLTCAAIVAGCAAIDWLHSRVTRKTLAQRYGHIPPPAGSGYGRPASYTPIPRREQDIIAKGHGWSVRKPK